MSPWTVGPAKVAMGKMSGTPVERRLARVGGGRRVSDELLSRDRGIMLETELFLHERVSTNLVRAEVFVSLSGYHVYRSSRILLKLEKGSPSPWKPCWLGFVSFRKANGSPWRDVSCIFMGGKKHGMSYNVQLPCTRMTRLETSKMAFEVA